MGMAASDTVGRLPLGMCHPCGVWTTLWELLDVLCPEYLPSLQKPHAGALRCLTHSPVCGSQRSPTQEKGSLSESEARKVSRTPRAGSHVWEGGCSRQGLVVPSAPRKTIMMSAPHPAECQQGKWCLVYLLPALFPKGTEAAHKTQMPEKLKSQRRNRVKGKITAESKIKPRVPTHWA